MIKQTALMESLSSNMHAFLKLAGQNLSLPNRKFLRDGFIGLVRAGKPIVCQMAREMPNHRAKFISRRDRLEQHLTQEDDFDDAVKQALPQVWLPLIDNDTPMILDLSDLCKPLAKKMDYIATVRDGSTGKLVNGYWLVEIYASLSRKNPIPIFLEPFSHEQPFCPGQNPIVLEVVHQLFNLTGNRGVLVDDRGFDGRTFLDDWLDHQYRFVTRLRGDRHVLVFSGNCDDSVGPDGSDSDGRWVLIAERLLAERTSTSHRWVRLIKRHGKSDLRITQVGWVKVRLPGRQENLTMVVSRLAGHDAPLMILTNLLVENLNDAQRVLRYYTRRWECEEGIRFLKSQVMLEKIRTFRWAAICRLVLLAVLVMIYLGWIVEHHPNLCDRLIRFGEPLPDEAEFLLYRLLTGLSALLGACFWLRRDLLQERLRKSPTV
jgi:hypothetical protein